MTNLTSLGFMDYYYEVTSDDYIFKTSDLNDKNMIETLLTIPKYATGEFSGPLIIVDDNSTYTPEQITSILANKNVGFDSRTLVHNNMNGDLNQWKSAISIDSNPLTVSYNLEANKTYVLFEKEMNKFNPHEYDENPDVIYDSNGNVYSDDDDFEMISVETLNTPISLEYQFINLFSFTPNSSGEYKFEFKKYGTHTFNLVDSATFVPYFDDDKESLAASPRSSNYDLNTDEGKRLLTKDVYGTLFKNNKLDWFTPFYYGDINIGEWTEIDLNGYKSTNIDYHVELKAGKHYLITNSGQNGEKGTYRYSFEDKNSVNFEKKGSLYGYEEFSSWSGTFDFQYISPKTDTSLFINNSVGNDYGIKIVPYHMGVFEIPIAELSGSDLIKYHRALLAGNLKPNISFDVLDDKPESGVTNKIITKKYVKDETLKLDLLVDKRYLVIHGGINKTSGRGRFDESISDVEPIFNNSIYLTTEHNDWDNSFSYVVYDGSKDTINFNIYGSYNSIKEGDDYFYGVFEVANDYVPTRENIIDDFVKDLYPSDHFNLSNKTQEVAFNVFDRDYLYSSDYSKTEKHFYWME